MHEGESDTLLGLMAGLETQVSNLAKSKAITSKVEPVPPPVTLAALPVPTTPVVHEPVPAPSHMTHAERATLAENFIVQWLVQQAVPWTYQQQVLDSLHKVRLGKWQLALVLTLALGAGVATGYVAVPQSIVQNVQGTYRSFACPVPATPTQPVDATPKQ